jgi:thioester reductase-like protein
MIEKLEKEQFDTLKLLADTNIKISDAKDTLNKLQDSESEYIISREEKVTEAINKLLEESSELLSQVHTNYQKVNDFCTVVSSYYDFLKEIHTKFEKMLDTSKKRDELWEENIRNQNQSIANQRKIIEEDRKRLDSDEENIKNKKKQLEKDIIYLESRQETLSVSYKEEQKLWNKIQSQ